MIAVEGSAALLAVLALVLSSACGLVISLLLPWKEGRQVSLGVPFGIALAPFLLGMSGIVSLALLPGRVGALHLGLTLGLLPVLAVAFRALAPAAARARASGLVARVRGAVAALWAGGDSLFAGYSLILAAHVALIALGPVTQNDSLEYLLAATEVHATGSLLSYPVLNPETNVTGFFGPWTHPPLYVVLLYLAQVIQGGPFPPGLTQFVSGWFFAAGSLLILGMAAPLGRRVAIGAALIFLTPPLFFLGAAQGLIDPLPVLGFGLVIAAILGLSGRGPARALVVGAVLGVALWTHSQAVLFLPLALAALWLNDGLGRPVRLAATSAGMLATALAIGGWHYLRNLETFGSLVSDDPAVFAFEPLHWDSYFSIGRGLDNAAALVQYGLFKGLFAFEAYGLAFWGTLVGMLFLLRESTRADLRRLLRGGSSGADRGLGVAWLCALLLAIYMAGIALSIALGIEHLVKNERYLLITLPLVAVLSSFGFFRLVDSLALTRGIAGSRLLVVGLGLQASTLVAYQAVGLQLHLPPLFQPEATQIYRLSQFVPIGDLDREAAETDRVFSMRPADMYYSRLRMLSYLDERMIDIYRLTDPAAVADRLAAMGVRYLHIPDYGLPPQYNTALQALLARPDLTTLRFQSSDAAIYELAPSGLDVVDNHDLSPGAVDWRRSDVVLMGGRKGLLGVTTARGDYTGGLSVGRGVAGLFHRNTVTALETGYRITDDPALAGLFASAEAKEYILDMSLSGYGLVRVWVDQETVNSETGESQFFARRLVTFELDPETPRRDLAMRFGLPALVGGFSVSIEHMGVSRLEVERVGLKVLGTR